MKRPIYLDNASSSFPKPKTVARAVARTIAEVGANPGRAGHRLGLKASRIVYGARLAIAELFDLPNPERIVFTKNATEGLNLALKGLLGRGDRVEISALEHNSVIRPLTALKRRGVRVDYAKLNNDGLPVAARPGARALVTVGGGNVSGALADVAALGAACADKKTLLIVDAAQTAGSVPFRAAGVDALVCTGHKGLLGPQGTGFVWFAPGVEPRPLLEGGTGSDSANPAMPAYWPDRHEAGTVNTPGIAGLKAAADYLRRRTLEAVRAHELALVRSILERLGADPRIVLYPPFDPERRASIVTFNVRGKDPALVGAALDRFGVACRVGLHCSPESHRFLGTFPEGAVRVSPGAMTAKADIGGFFKALDRALANL